MPAIDFSERNENFESRSGILQMVDFRLAEDELAVRETARQFAMQDMAPKAAHYDTTMDYPWPVIRRAQEAGLLNLHLPEKFGGSGLGAFSHALVAEELAAGCAGIATAIAANDLALSPLIASGDEALIEELAAPMGTIQEQPTMAAYCVTEPGAGSDVQSIRTTIKRVGNDYVMNGEKMWITNASVANWLYVLATLEPGAGHKAMCAFAVPANLDGIEIGKKEINLGQRCSDTRGIVFNNVCIPKRYLLGQEGEGFKIAMRAFDSARPNVAAGAVGVSRRAMEHAIHYAQERKAFGKPIAQHQAIAFMIADMAKEIEAARFMTWAAAKELEAGRRASKYASMAKCMAGDTAVKVTSDAIQIFGGYGYNSEYPVEKLYRDAKIYQIYEGTQQIQRLIISRQVMEEYS